MSIQWRDDGPLLAGEGEHGVVYRIEPWTKPGMPPGAVSCLATAWHSGKWIERAPCPTRSDARALCERWEDETGSAVLGMKEGGEA